MWTGVKFFLDGTTLKINKPDDRSTKNNNLGRMVRILAPVERQKYQNKF